MMWVFAYGSLMWRPGFSFTARHPALLPGFSRAFCRLSFRHRGTPEAPGMVLGLVPGAGCRGVAYGVEVADWPAVQAYLDQREGSGYRRITVPIEMVESVESADSGEGQGREMVEALTYLPEPSHPSHAPQLPQARMVELIATGVGESGTAREYLSELIAQLAQLEVEEPKLLDLMEKVKRYHKANAPGAHSPGQLAAKGS